VIRTALNLLTGRHSDAGRFSWRLARGRESTASLGIHARRFGDEFAFEPFPGEAIAISTDLRMEADEVGFTINTLDSSEKPLSGLGVTIRSDNGHQFVLFPSIGSQHEVRLAWYIDVSSNREIPLAKIKRPGRFVQSLQRGGTTELDLLKNNPVKLNIKLAR
jgi:hypothetical protein